MAVTEWVILAAAVAAVLMIYLITRRNNGPNPWQDMEAGDDELPANSGSQGSDDNAPDVIVDPSVAGEWEDFRPERVEPLDDISKPVSKDVDDINPASLRNEPVPEGTELTTPSEAMLGYVSEPRPVSRDESSEPLSARPSSEAPPDAAAQKIVVLHVVAQDGAQLAGPAIHNALQQCGLQYGEREVYHRAVDVDGHAESVFSVANMLKPGTLKPEEADGLKTKGLVMFMLLPGPVDGNKAFHDMLNTAQKLAEQLQARVLDDKRLPLTRQAAQYQIDEIAELERQQRLAGA